MVFRLGYHGHGLSSRTASCVLPLFVTTLLLVPAASNVTTFLFLWELMAVTSLLLVLVDHRRRSEVAVGRPVVCGDDPVRCRRAAGGPGPPGHPRRQPVVRRHRRQVGTPAGVGAETAAFVLAVVGFGSKAGMVPLHVWLPRAHPEAPGPVSALMSAAMVNLGVYGIVRVGDGLLGGGPAWWWLLVMALGALSALFGSLHSATSSDLKRLLAYSTTDNVGLMLLGVGASGLFASTGHRALALVALVAALLHVVFHAVFKGSLFLSASSLQQATGTRDLDRLGGSPPAHAGDRHALLGRRPGHRRHCPPLCGFVSEWLLLQAMLHGLPSSDPAARGRHAHRRRRPRPHRRADRPDLREGRRHRAAWANPGATGRPKRGEVRPSMWLGAGILATLCLVFGVAPFLVVPAVARRRPQRHRGPASPTPWWAAGRSVWPASTACSPPASWLSALLVAVTLVAGARRLLQPARGRRTEAWGCGRELQTARMEYTATSFGEPLTRVFEDVLQPAHDLDVSHVAESRYYVEAARFHTSLDDAFERHAYRPASVGLGWWGALARRVPNGSIHRYLAFGLVALIVVLVVLG